jgi:cytoskeletal protein CcmA (bactofilin family)
MMPPRSEMRPYGVEGKTLVVGREISLSGQIAACDKLVVEGRVEAELDHCRQLDIAQTGFFKGSADIDEAEISGRFEGKLTVHKRLRVRSSAHIKGTVAYGQIEVEAGGEISGDIQLYVPAEDPAKAAGPKREGSPVEAGE